MALGKLKKIENADQKFGADPWYWFVKVQPPHGGEKGEEYWLVTEEEALLFGGRAEKNPEDDPGLRRGVFAKVQNRNPHPAANAEYYGLFVVDHSGTRHLWMLTDHDLIRIRDRSKKNHEDIEANREGWLADLFD